MNEHGRFDHCDGCEGDDCDVFDANSRVQAANDTREAQGVLLAILVDRLGGDVEISAAEFEHTDLDLTVGKKPAELSYILRTHHKIEDVTDAEHHPTQTELNAMVQQHRDSLAASYAALWRRTAVPRSFSIADVTRGC